MIEPIVFLRRYERLVQRLPSFFILSIVGFGLVLGVPWALGTRGTVEVLPPSIALTLWAGENTSYMVNVHNGLGGQATVLFDVRVMQTPSGGSPSDLQLSYAPWVTLGPGNVPITVHLQVAGEAVPGTYTLIQQVVLQA